MAQMIPPRVHEDAPSSERRVFDRLRLDPATEGWTVLHSLGLSHRGKKPYGEIDFVVMVPDGGVVCLEVKGGRIRCEQGVWYTRNRVGQESPLSRSPHAQVRDAMFALRDAALARFGASSDVGRLLYTGLVVFPDVPRPPDGPEHEPWETIDVDDLRGPISRSVLLALRGARQRLGRERGQSGATVTALRELRNFLRPDFDVGIARATSIQRSEDRIIHLTEEQYDVLDLFERNPRCLVEGAAGTGKTLLALEFVRRQAHTGQKILLFSFNRLLGEWLTARTRELLPDAKITCGSYHACLRRFILKSSVADEFLVAERGAQAREKDLFGLIYPLYALEALAECRERADLLILDEAQDLIDDAVLDVLNEWVVGGLSGGRWVMLGDFTRQAIYSHSGATARESLGPYADQFTDYRLRRNCRNTRSIGEETALLSGFESLPYRLDDQDCLPVDYRYWTDRPHQLQRLLEVLRVLERDGVPDSDVVVLSPHRFDRSVASEVPGGRIVPIDGLTSTGGGLAFSTIHAFKGLESPAVIVCDIDDLDSAQGRSLLYVGMSRARSHLIVLVHEGMRRVVSGAVDRKLAKGWS